MRYFTGSRQLSHPFSPYATRTSPRPILDSCSSPSEEVWFLAVHSRANFLIATIGKSRQRRMLDTRKTRRSIMVLKTIISPLSSLGSEACRYILLFTLLLSLAMGGVCEKARISLCLSYCNLSVSGLINVPPRHHVDLYLSRLYYRSFDEHCADASC